MYYYIFSDGEFFNNETWLSKIKTDAGTNWRLKVRNLYTQVIIIMTIGFIENKSGN